MNLLLYRILWLCISSASAWLLLHAMEYLIGFSPSYYKRWLMLFSCWILDSVVIHIGDSFNILTALPCFLAAVLLCCRGSLWKKLAVGSMYASTVLSFNALRDNFLKSIYCSAYSEKLSANMQILHFPYILLASSASGCLFSLFLYIGIRKFAPDKDYTLSDSLWRLLFLLTATPLGIILCVTALHPEAVPGQSVEYLLLLLISLLSFVSLLWCIIVLSRQQKLEQQNMFMEINRKYYETMEQQYFETRRLKHDLANHMQVLAALPGDQQADYIRNLCDLTAGMQSLSCCGDATVNAVLTVKGAMMEQHHIRMEASVDIPTALPLDKTHVCALFANALDNAIEACMKLPEKDRTVSLKSKARKGLFCLQMSNPLPNTDRNMDVPDRPPLQGPVRIPPTSKADKENHGLGLQSIREIVSGYHGNMEIKTAEGSFELFLYFYYS